MVETLDFPLEERKKAYLKAMLVTNQYRIGVREALYFLIYGARYGLLAHHLGAFLLRYLEYFRKRYYLQEFFLRYLGRFKTKLVRIDLLSE